MNQSRRYPIVRSALALTVFSAACTGRGFAQTAKLEEVSSSSQSTSLASALFAPMNAQPAEGAGLTGSLPNAPSEKRRVKVETSVSLGGTPQLTATRILNVQYGGFATQSLHPSAGLLATFRQTFSPWLGYSLNLGYTRAAEHNTNNAGVGQVGTYANFYIPNNVYEFSVSHVAHAQLSHKLTAFSELGAGAMMFQPAKEGGTYLVPSGLCCTAVGASFRPLIVFGVGADYHFNPHWALRAEYRGLLYKYPDYGQTIPRLTTITSEPTVSLTYRFGSKKTTGTSGMMWRGVR